MENTLGLRDYFLIIRKRLWLIILVTAICTGISAIVSYNFLTPIYQAKTEVLINKYYKTSDDQPPATIPPGDVDANLKLVETYKDIVTSPRVIDEVYKEIGNSIVLYNHSGYFNRNQEDPIETLTKMVTVEISDKSQVITIIVQHPDPKQAALIADTVTTVFQKQVGALMYVDNVQVMSNAKVSSIPVSPKPILNISLAFAFGLLLSVIIAFLLKHPK